MPLYLLLLMAMSMSSGPIHHIRTMLVGVPVHQVTVDLSSQDLSLTVCLAKGGVGHGESFGSMVKRLNPLIAITGDFYDTRTFKPVGDIVIDGKVIHDGCIGPALIVLNDGSTRIVSQSEYEKIPKSTLRLGMQTGPTLVKAGKVAVNVRAEGFHHITGSACRTAVGLTANNKLVMVAVNTSISFNKLAGIMLKAGCTDAVALDGGSSTGIHYDGRIRIRPTRLMTSLLVVLPNQAIVPVAKSGGMQYNMSREETNHGNSTTR